MVSSAAIVVDLVPGCKGARRCRDSTGEQERRMRVEDGKVARTAVQLGLTCRLVRALPFSS